MKKILPYMLALSSLTACTKDSENVLKRSYFKQNALEIAEFAKPNAAAEIESLFKQGRLVHVSDNPKLDHNSSDPANNPQQWALVNKENEADTLMTLYHVRNSKTDSKTSTYDHYEHLHIISENAKSFSEGHRQYIRRLNAETNDQHLTYEMR